MGYPYREDFKDIITEDCELVLDLDQTCFVAAAGSEKRTIKAVHKRTGKEKVFKTRTEFWGAGKKAIGGWLGDQNMNMEAKAKRAGKEFTPWGRDDFDIIDIQTPEPVEFCLHLLKTKVDAIMGLVDLKNGKGVLGGVNNFRLRIPSPEIYKGNREETLRPLLLGETREYVKKKYNAVVIDDIEADDYLSMLGFEGWRNYKKNGKFTHMIASFDKDQVQCPSLILNTMRDADERVWKHPLPMLIDDSIGEIWMEKGKVKGWGQKFFGYQMLCGDSSDNVKPYQNFDIRFGDKSCFDILSVVETEKEMWEVIMDQYVKWFPDGVKFKSHCGKDIEYTPGQWASSIFQMVYMKRVPNDPTTLAKLLKKKGVI